MTIRDKTHLRDIEDVLGDLLTATAPTANQVFTWNATNLKLVAGRQHLVICIYRGVALIDTNQPAAVREIFNTTEKEIYVDLREFTKCKVHVNVTTIGAANAEVGVQYSVDDGTTWKGLDNDTTNGISDIFALSDATGQVKSAFMTIQALALVEECRLRVVTAAGDGVLDPAYTSIDLEFQ